MFRSALFACASVMIAAAAAPALAETPAENVACAETSVRIYFRDGAADLDATARETLDVAERMIADCAYSELRVTVDASNPLARERADAIVAAAEGRAWDATRVEARTMRTVSHRAGPDYAEVVMSPTRGAPTRGAAGV